MYCASDYRSMARRALKNFWWLAVGVTLLATVLGGGTSSFTVSFQNSDVSRYYPEAMRRFTSLCRSPACSPWDSLSSAAASRSGTTASA